MSKMLYGDCLYLLPLLPDSSVDMVLADLPYGATRNAWDSLIDLDRLWPELLRVTKPRSPIVMTAQMPFTATLYASQPRLFRHHWVWEKTTVTGHLNAKRAPMKAHEDVLVFSRQAPTYNPQMTHGHPRKVSTAQHKRGSRFSDNWGTHEHADYDSTSRYPRSVIKFATDKQRTAINPTQKPVALFEYLIKTYSAAGGLVLDVASGSGTTAVAAEATGRDWICMEKDWDQYIKAKARLDEVRESA